MVTRKTFDKKDLTAEKEIGFMRPLSNLQNNTFDERSDFIAARTESFLIASLQHLQQKLATLIY